MKRLLIVFLLIIAAIGSILALQKKTNTSVTSSQHSRPTKSVTFSYPGLPDLTPLTITAMKEKSYPGSQLIVEQTLNQGSNYNRYIVSYLSDGLKIYGLLTVPLGNKPAGGWPIVLMNHGYIPPAQYSTISSYAASADEFARNGYIIFKPDYRGNGNSEGQPAQVYISSGYVDDTMNAIASIKQYKDANPLKIGLWGHSMGGNITLHDLILSKDVKAAVLWSGVVGSSGEILDWWQKRIASGMLQDNDRQTSTVVQNVLSIVGTPTTNSDFWHAIDPTNYVSDISAPVQIDVGTADGVVPMSFSTGLRDKLQQQGKSVVYFVYPGADHNLSPDFSLAMQRTIAFFDAHLK